MENNAEQIVAALAKKAEKAGESIYALQYSQAAVNVANAFCALSSIPKT